MKKPELAEALLTAELPPRVAYLPPLLLSGSLGLIHARAGIGKTSLALWMAYAVAGNGSFMRWAALMPARVLYVDSEMGRRAMQERLRQVVGSAAHDVEAGMMSFVYPETSDGAGVDISLPAGQEYLTREMETRDILFLDNLGGMSPRGARETEEQVWTRIQPWLIRLRAANKCVVLLHHSGKSGAQLGTSMKEQPQDWIISMTRPADYEPTQGLRADVKFEKFRNGTGVDASSFTVSLEGSGNELVWRWCSQKDELLRRIQERKSYGMKPAQIAKDLGVGTFVVIKALRDAEANGAQRCSDQQDPLF
jgi:RecA-family ATPase